MENYAESSEVLKILTQRDYRDCMLMDDNFKPMRCKESPHNRHEAYISS